MSAIQPNHRVNSSLQACGRAKRSQYFQTIYNKRLICVCCLAQRGTFVGLRTCMHLALFCCVPHFLATHTNRYVCINCHDILIKFSLFSRQVKENSDLLIKQDSELKMNRIVLDLRQSPTEYVTFIRRNKTSNDEMDSENSFLNSPIENVNIEPTLDDLSDGETTDDAEFDIEVMSRNATKKVTNSETQTSCSEAKILKLSEEVVDLTEPEPQEKERSFAEMPKQFIDNANDQSRLNPMLEPNIPFPDVKNLIRSDHCSINAINPVSHALPINQLGSTTLLPQQVIYNKPINEPLAQPFLQPNFPFPTVGNVAITDSVKTKQPALSKKHKNPTKRSKSKAKQVVINEEINKDVEKSRLNPFLLPNLPFPAIMSDNGVNPIDPGLNPTVHPNVQFPTVKNVKKRKSGVNKIGVNPTVLVQDGSSANSAPTPFIIDENIAKTVEQSRFNSVLVPNIPFTEVKKIIKSETLAINPALSVKGGSLTNLIPKQVIDENIANTANQSGVHPSLAPNIHLTIEPVPLDKDGNLLAKQGVVEDQSRMNPIIVPNVPFTEVANIAMNQHADKLINVIKTEPPDIDESIPILSEEERAIVEEIFNKATDQSKLETILEPHMPFSEAVKLVLSENNGMANSNKPETSIKESPIKLPEKEL